MHHASMGTSGHHTHHHQNNVQSKLSKYTDENRTASNTRPPSKRTSTGGTWVAKDIKKYFYRSQLHSIFSMSQGTAN